MTTRNTAHTAADTTTATQIIVKRHTSTATPVGFSGWKLLKSDELRAGFVMVHILVCASPVLALPPVESSPVLALPL